MIIFVNYFYVLSFGIVELMLSIYQYNNVHIYIIFDLFIYFITNYVVHHKHIFVDYYII